MIKPKRLALLSGIPILVLLLLLWTGWPQKIVLASIMEKALGAKVDLVGGQYGRTLSWDSITLYSPDDSNRTTPVSVFEGVTVSYDLFAKDGRKVPTVHINSLTLSPDASDPESPNYQFLLDLLQAESTTDDATWMPRSITIDDVSVKGRWPDGELSISGIQVAIACRSLTDIRVNIDLEDQLESSHVLRGRVTINLQEEGMALEAQDLIGMLHGERWMPLLHFLWPESGLNAGAIKFKIPMIQWDSAQGIYPSGEMSTRIQGLEVSQAGEILFTGDVQAKGTFSGGLKLDSTMLLAINQALQAELFISLSESDNSVALGIEDWSKTNLLTVLPPHLQFSIEGLPFEHLRASIDLQWNEKEYAINGTITSETKTIDVDMAVHGELDSSSSILGTVDARVGDGLLQASGRMDEAGLYLGEVTLKQVPLSPFALLVAGVQLPKSVSGVLDGEVIAHQQEDSRVMISSVITLRELHYEAMQFDALTLQGEVLLDYDTRVAQSEKITLQTEDESIFLAVEEIKLTLDSGDMTGGLTYTFPVEMLAIDECYGTLAGAAQLNKTGNLWTIPLEYHSDYLGYGDLTLPYGSELKGKGTLEFHDKTQELVIRDAHAKIGEGTLIIIPEAQLNEAGWSGNMQFDSELSLLVDMGYIAEVDGVLHAEASWSMLKDKLQVDWKTKADIAKLVLSDQAATISTILLNMEGRYDTEFHGEGTVSVESLDVAGATLKEFSGSLRFEKNVLVVPESAMQVFGGTMASRIEVHLMEEGFPIDFEGKLENIDLARMTEEVQPPKAKLTGQAQGTVEVRYSLTKGLEEFDLDVESDENFTLNRSLVEELMGMQTVLSGLGKKRAQKTMEKFLGKADQRPFDFAAMNVFLLENSVIGVTELHSEKTKDYNGLNLVIQLDIDKPALVQSLKMLEESSLAEVEF